MRIAIALASTLALTLAGCGQRAGNDQNAAGAQSGLPTPGARPDDAGSAAQNAERDFRQAYRTINIGSCISSAEARAARGGGAPPGIDFRAACSCYIDRAMVGLNMAQLRDLRPGPREEAILQQCAREAGLADGNGGTGGK